MSILAGGITRDSDELSNCYGESELLSFCYFRVIRVGLSSSSAVSCRTRRVVFVYTT